MSGRALAFLAALIVVAALAVVGSPAAPVAQAAPMCPPVTLDDLFPPPTTPSTTTPEPVTTTTIPGTTTSVPTTTTVPSTTSVPTTTTTTPPGEAGVLSIAAEPTSPPPTRPAGCRPFRYAMSWPLAGEGRVISGFGADRDHGSRHHKGIDIAAPRLTPVVAVADGVVIQVVQEIGTEECCWLGIRHRDGWQSFYVHLNNDRHGTDDGLGVGVRPDLEVGTEVAEGEVIGWVGDSGNAEESVDHLHFELRTPGGVSVDAGPSVKTARKPTHTSEQSPEWPYADDDDLPTQWIAARLLSEGLFLPCPDSPALFCPQRVADPGFSQAVVTFFAPSEPPLLEGMAQTLPGSLDLASQTPSMVERAIGCAPIEDCLDVGVTESELARLAVWARRDIAAEGVPPQASNIDGIHDLNLPTAEEAEAALRAEGVIGSCEPHLDSEVLVTREQTLIRLVAWIRGIDPNPCWDRLQATR